MNPYLAKGMLRKLKDIARFNAVRRGIHSNERENEST